MTITGELLMKIDYNWINGISGALFLVIGFYVFVGAIGIIFSAYKYNLKEDHLQISVYFLGFIPLPGLKVLYTDIDCIRRGLFEGEIPYYSYASLWYLLNYVQIILKNRKIFKMVLITPEEPDIFIIRLQEKL